jgi:hypothetical protein
MFDVISNKKFVHGHNLNHVVPKLEVPKQNDIWVLPMAKHKEYYKGEGGGFPQVRVVVSLMNPCLLMVCPCTKSALTTH